MVQRRRSWWVGHALVTGAVVVSAACGGRSANDDESGGRNADTGVPPDSRSGGQGGIASAGSGGDATAVGGVSGGASNAASGSAGITASGGSVGGSDAGGASGREPDLRGNWAAFAFEDPVGVSFEQDGKALSGYGCCAGLDRTDLNCCGQLQGTIDKHRAEFTIVTDSPGPFTYTAKVAVSADGQRMTGSLNGAAPMTWVRLAAGQKWLQSDDTALQRAFTLREGSYDLALNEAGGDEFAPARSYGMRVSAYGMVPLLTGDLGAYWGGEMKWDEAAETLTVGPVSVTSDSLPTALELRFTGSTLTTVKATLPSGNTYAFDATRAAR